MSEYPDPMPHEVQMALGRLFRMMSRPSQSGDIAMFHRIQKIVMDAAGEQSPEYRPDYVAQRLQGAQGE
jgi:hypothetical protein